MARTTPGAAPEGCRYNHRTADGRAALDAAVRAELAKRGELSRGDIAEALGLELRVAAAALRRLVEAGIARAFGERALRRYAAARRSRA